MEKLSLIYEPHAPYEIIKMLSGNFSLSRIIIRLAFAKSSAMGDCTLIDWQSSDNVGYNMLVHIVES